MSCCTSAPIVTQTCETLLSKCEVPIIDLAHMGTERCPQKGVVKQVATKLVRALSEKGLALLVNHGIPECKPIGAYTHAADNTKHRVTSVETEQQPAERPRSRCDDLQLLG